MKKNYKDECGTQRERITEGSTNSKLKLYSEIKTKHSLENYLSLINDFKVRKSVSQLIISAHHFPIETPREQRKCKIHKYYYKN
jgi:hypothetical protein